jgi:hypothetical protein
MAIINQATKELQVKIVYYGPAKSGQDDESRTGARQCANTEPGRERKNDVACDQLGSHPFL